MRWLRRPGPPKNETGAQLQGLTATNTSVLLLCRGCRWRRRRCCQQLRQCLSSKKSRVMGQGQKGKNNKKKGEEKKKNNSRVSNAPATTRQQQRTDNHAPTTTAAAATTTTAAAAATTTTTQGALADANLQAFSPTTCQKERRPEVTTVCLVYVFPPRPRSSLFSSCQNEKGGVRKAGSGKERRTQQAARVKHGSK